MEDTPRLSDVATLRGVCSAPIARLRIADTAANETTLHCGTATHKGGESGGSISSSKIDLCPFVRSATLMRLRHLHQAAPRPTQAKTSRPAFHAESMQSQPYSSLRCRQKCPSAADRARATPCAGVGNVGRNASRCDQIHCATSSTQRCASAASPVVVHTTAGPGAAISA